MSQVLKSLSSSIGCKVIMAVTGLALVGFLVSHLAGNLLIFAGPETFNAYAKGLHDLGAILWVLRFGLIVTAVLHIGAAIRLSALNRAATPVAYAKKHPNSASLASRTMLVSGSIVLAFLLYHLAHFTFLWTHPEYADLPKGDVYSMVIMGFQSPLVALLYIVANALFCLHLNHGIQSAAKSIGVSHPLWRTAISKGGAGLSIVLTVGFLSIPISILLGWVA